MGYFPCFLDLTNRNCLIIGGGHVALRKAEKLVSFTSRLTVIAPEICAEIKQMEQVTLRQRAFQEADLDGAFLVVSATDNHTLNRQIFHLCQEKGILVNTVDDRENCGFLFPALAQYETITVGVNTAGTSPLFAKYLREQIQRLLAEKGEIGVLLGTYRQKILARFSTEHQRKAAMEAILERCLRGDSLPDEGEIDSILEGFSQ